MVRDVPTGAVRASFWRAPRSMKMSTTASPRRYDARPASRPNRRMHIAHLARAENELLASAPSRRVRAMVPNVWTQRKAPLKRGQAYGSLRKKGYWSSATGQFRAWGSVPRRERSPPECCRRTTDRAPPTPNLRPPEFSPIYRHFSEENRSSASSPLFSAIFGVRNRQ